MKNLEIKNSKTRNISLMSSKRNKLVNDFSNKIALTQANENTTFLPLMRNEISYPIPCFKKINNKQLKPYSLLQPKSPPKLRSKEKSIKNHKDYGTSEVKLDQPYNDRDVVKSLSCFDFSNKETESTFVHQELSPSLSRPIDKKIRISLVKQSRNTNRKKDSITVNNVNNTNRASYNPIDNKSINIAVALLRTARDMSYSKKNTKLKLKPKPSLALNGNSLIVNAEIEAPENIHFIFVSLIQRNKKCLAKNEHKGNSCNSIEDEYEL